MKLLIFLGNPGKKYEKTRHNAGWIVADIFRDTQNLSPFTLEKKFFGEISTGIIAGEKAILLKPDTFMNLSGKALLAVAQFYKISPEDVLLIYDDKDQELGKVRFREKGSAGGHNGVKDCIRVFGSENIARIKIGVDTPIRTEHNMNTADFVLSNFSKEELKNLKKDIYEEVEEKILEWAS